MSDSPLITLLFMALGGSMVVVWLIYYNLTHQKEIKAALKSRQKDLPFSQKLAPNYSPKERRFALAIGLYAVVLAAISLFFFLQKHQLASQAVLFLIPTGIFTLINLGNRITK